MKKMNVTIFISSYFIDKYKHEPLEVKNLKIESKFFQEKKAYAYLGPSLRRKSILYHETINLVLNEFPPRKNLSFKHEIYLSEKDYKKNAKFINK